MPNWNPPELIELGKIELIEIFIFYDEPRLFSCKNNWGQYFLSVWVEESDEGDVWLYVPISKVRLEYVRTGQIDLRTAFQIPEKGYAFKVITSFGFEPAKIDKIQGVDLNEDDLPKEGVTLNLPNIEVETVTTYDTLHEYAQKIWRDIIRIKLRFNEQNLPEAPIDLLGDLLSVLQDTINTIGKAIFSTPRGREYAQPLGWTDLVLVKTYSGSFELEIISANISDLAGDSPVSAAFEKLFSLINYEDDPSILQQMLISLKSRSALKYKKLLKLFSETGTEAELQWVSPNIEKKGHAIITPKSANRDIEVIEAAQELYPNTFMVVGKLIGVNIRLRNYEIYSEDEQKKYSGTIDLSVFDEINKFTVGELYIGFIEEVTEKIISTGVQRTKYILKELKKPPLSKSDGVETP